MEQLTLITQYFISYYLLPSAQEKFPLGPIPGNPKQGLGRAQTEDSTISDDEDGDEGRQEQGTSPTVPRAHNKAQPVRG